MTGCGIFWLLLYGLLFGVLFLLDQVAQSLIELDAYLYNERVRPWRDQSFRCQILCSLGTIPILVEA